MKKKTTIILTTVFVMIIFLAAMGRTRFRRTIAAAALSEEIQQQMEEELQFTEHLSFQLICGQEKVPYDLGTDTYYLPQTTSGDWIWDDFVSLGDSRQKLYWCADKYWEDMESAIAEGHRFQFYVVEGEYARKGNIVFTGLPMMKLEILQSEPSPESPLEEIHYCKVTTFDPFYSKNNAYEIKTCFGYLALRGRTSKAFPKKGWDLDLVKENGLPYKMPLFGLREDDDWKLNALYPDETKVREAVCMELWNEIAAETETVYDSGTNMSYFEMITDDEYMGLYGAMEQIDYKQLSMDKGEDIIYKGYAWPGERHPERYEPEEEYFGHLIKTGGRPITEELWGPLLSYVSAANFDQHLEQCDTEELYRFIRNQMNMDNFLALDLFVQILGASDNRYKNVYLVADRRDNRDYTLWKVPWDLNYTFGDRFNVDAQALTEYNLEWSQELLTGFMLTETLLQSGNQEFIRLINEKWAELRNGIFSLENVQKIAEENQELLMMSGAFERDAKRWPESPHSTSLSEILEFHSCRINFLDAYYASYLNEK